MKILAYHKSLKHLHVGCENPRAYFIPFASQNNAKEGNRNSSEYYFNLCGKWNFRFYESFEDIKEEHILNISSQFFDETIDVPSNWQMLTDRKYDKPLYSNLKYPFPTDPPHVPDENPCGVYSKEFTLPNNFYERRLFLNFEGVSSSFYVWMNGSFVGYSQVSHSTSEFDISEFTNHGINRIVVLVVKWCDGSYLEDQDFFRLSGIFRDVYILARSSTRIVDIFVKTKINESLSKAEIIVSAKLSSDCIIEYILNSPEKTTVSEGTKNSSNFSIVVNMPALWNDENPKLYDLYLTVSDEVILIRIGIKKLVIKEGVILLNGKAVKSRGINRHDFNPELGYTTSVENMQNDLFLLKQNNCNTIRTSHYPNDPRFLELCDELGFMVVNEADIETHGMGYNTDTNWDWYRWSQLSDAPEWCEAYVDRAARLFERDKNHACIIMWSLGNESGIGENHRAMADYIRSREKTSLIHYENAHKEFKAIPNNKNYFDISDVESRMYADIQYIKDYLEDSNNSKPFFLCEYVDSMTTGDVYAYWDLVQQNDKFFGGCIWEMTDHAIGITDEHKKVNYYYGGDFGEFPNDGICCLDGLVYPDRKPRPGLLDMKRVYQPYKVSFEDDYSISIESYRYFSNMNDLDLYWKIDCDGSIVCDGRISRLDICPREKKSFVLFNEGDYTFFGDCYLTLAFIQNKETAWAQAGYETGFEQFKLDTPRLLLNAKLDNNLSYDENDRYLRIDSGNSIYTFDKAYGRVCSLVNNGREMLEKPIVFKLWRAPTYNGAGITKMWRDAGIDHIKQKLYSCEIIERSEKCVQILLTISLGSPSVPPVIKAAVNYSFFSNGNLVIGINGKIREDAPPMPRIGLEITMPKGNEYMEYFGYGPKEAYVDKHKTSKIGKYTIPVTDNFEHYIRPQENSSHYGTRWGMVGDSDGQGLYFSGNDFDNFCFNASHYSAEMITQTDHDFNLLPAEETFVNLDWRMNSISENMQIAEKESNRTLKDKQFCFSFRVKPVDMKAANPFEILHEEL